MMTFSPAAVASRAASSLLAMPPLPSPPARSRTRPNIDSSSRSTVEISRLAPTDGIAVVKSLDVGEQHQQRGAEQVRDNRRQPVVVAEGGLQFLDADGVVLVDDRHGPQFQQGDQGIAGVEVAGAVFEVLGGQQDLGGVMAVAPTAPARRPRPARLWPMAATAWRWARSVGRRGQAQASHAGPDGAGADQDHLPPAGPGGVQLFGQLGHAAPRRVVRRRGSRRGCPL